MSISRYCRLCALVAGLSTMAIEMVGSRALAPSFGTSLPVWTNLIGLFMAGLALGSFLGGRLAMGGAGPTTLAKLLGVSGIYGMGLPLMTDHVFAFLRDYSDLGEAAGSFIGILLVYVPPVLLLGALGPVSIGLSTRSAEESGGSSGWIYALTTIGSLAGTLIPALITLPLLGVRLSTWLFSGLLLITAGTWVVVSDPPQPALQGVQ